MTDANSLTIAMAQLNPVVGDIAGNLARVLAARAQAQAVGADLVVCGELVVSGYPPEDLVFKPSFLDAVEKAVARLAAATTEGAPALLIGAPWRADGKLFNSALLLDKGRIVARCDKYDLPNYSVFDEKRVFTPGLPAEPVSFRSARLGIMVCEDMWTALPARHLADTGADMLIVINGSPYETGKVGRRLGLARKRAAETGLPLLYVNQAGGQDELVFDGASFVIDEKGDLRHRLKYFAEDLRPTHWTRKGKTWECAPGECLAVAEETEAIYRALVLGLRDYVDKNGFPGVLIGLSGGIDSALVAAVAVDALGPARVHGVMMPSPYTSDHSLQDADNLAKNLGIRLDTISIVPAMEAFDSMLKEIFIQHPIDTTEENIQARARAITLMALSNKFGFMVLSTGNKSEMSVGYATLYGDMCGGFSVLKDVYKTTVYALSRWRNAHKPGDALGPGGAVIPEHVLTRAPSAELKPNQKDEDALLPYDRLDGILYALIERDLGIEDIVAQGYAREEIMRVWQMVEGAEYKRRQAAPGIKVTGRAFGKDRRYPITNRFRGTS